MRFQQQTLAARPATRHVRHYARHAFSLLAVLGFTACADAPSSVSPSSSPVMNRSEGRGTFQRYVAIGSGISMGWQSDGVTAASQYESWPAQLARLAHREMDQPYLATPSCFPPIVPPLGSFARASSGPCANAPGVTLPTQNLAIRGATVTSALTAMVGGATPDSGYGFTSVMPLVLPPGVTQVDGVGALRPKIVSVEYGISEMLRALVTPVPNALRVSISPPAWWALYDQILDAVTRPTDVALLALPSRVLPPGFMRSDVLVGSLVSPQAQSQFNIAPPPFPCEPPARLIYAPRYLQTVIGQGLNARAQGQGPVPLDCNLLFRSDLSFSADTYDLVRTAIQAIRTHIVDQAAARGVATFDLEALYLSATQPSFDVIQFMSSNTPFGPYVSLDGIYPSAAGNQLLAEAAARALNAQYGIGLPVFASAGFLGR